MSYTFPNWPKSKAGCARQLNAVINRYRREFAGGGSFGFGFDWPTFRLNSPELYARARALQQLWHELPFKDGSRLPR